MQFLMSDQIWLPILGLFLNFFFDFMRINFDKLAPP